jgi:hypothetical protein
MLVLVLEAVATPPRGVLAGASSAHVCRLLQLLASSPQAHSSLRALETKLGQSQVDGASKAKGGCFQGRWSQGRRAGETSRMESFSARESWRAEQRDSVQKRRWQALGMPLPLSCSCGDAVHAMFAQISLYALAVEPGRQEGQGSPHGRAAPDVLPPRGEASHGSALRLSRGEHWAGGRLTSWLAWGCIKRELITMVMLAPSVCSSSAGWRRGRRTRPWTIPATRPRPRPSLPLHCPWPVVVHQGASKQTMRAQSAPVHAEARAERSSPRTDSPLSPSMRAGRRSASDT